MSERKNNRESQNRNRQNNVGQNQSSRSGDQSGRGNTGRNQGNPYGSPQGGPYQGDPYNQAGYGQNGYYQQNGNGPYNQNGYQGRPPYQGQQGPNGYYQGGPYQNGNYQNSNYQNGRYQGQRPPYQNDPRQNGSNQQNPEDGGKKKSGKRKTRKRIIFAIEIIVLLVLAIGLFVFSKMSKLTRQDIPKDDIMINSEMTSDQAKVLKGYRNIALYGVDSRDGLTEDALSDTIMIASINRETKDVKLVSVYRDTYLDNTNGEYRKATECYLMGGPKRSINMLNKNLDLDITDYVTVNFNALAEVVERLKGVEIDVQENEIVNLNDYQVEGSQVTGMEIVPVTQTGPQTLNGLQALSYCRIRYTEGSDFKRTERQRTVLEQIMKKAKSTDLLTLNSIVDAVLPNVSSSLGNLEILDLAKDLAAYNIVDTTGFPFDHQPDNNQAGDCVVPVNLANNVVQLHQYLFGSNGYAPSATVQEISDKIVSDTGIQ